jgi:hypothetical protein
VIHESLLLAVKCRSGECLEAQLKYVCWTKTERRSRALKVLGIGLLLAFCFLFLPIVHFVLVPSALLIAPVVAWLIYEQSASIPKQSLTCPKCNSSVEWPACTSFEKKEIFCDSCRSVIEVSVIRR